VLQQVPQVQEHDDADGGKYKKPDERRCGQNYRMDELDETVDYANRFTTRNQDSANRLNTC